MAGHRLVLRSRSEGSDLLVHRQQAWQLDRTVRDVVCEQWKKLPTDQCDAELRCWVSRAIGCGGSAADTSCETTPIASSPVQQLTRKQTIHQSQLCHRARNCLRIETVSIKQLVSCSTRQKLGNSRYQTVNFVEQQSCATKLLNCVACLTWALGLY